MLQKDDVGALLWHNRAVSNATSGQRRRWFGTRRSSVEPAPVDITERLSILDLRASVRLGTEAAALGLPGSSTSQSPSAADSADSAGNQAAASELHGLEPAEGMGEAARGEAPTERYERHEVGSPQLVVDLTEPATDSPGPTVEVTEPHGEPIAAAVAEHLRQQPANEPWPVEDDAVVRWVW